LEDWRLIKASFLTADSKMRT